ncbi:MAG: aconitase X, partial [Kiloniellales bacterium]|nr:aconitase X [Kiloniellales bacterium]
STALVGRVPLAGLHSDEGRCGGVLFDISALCEERRQSEIFCHLLGLVMGRMSGSDVPVILGLPGSVTKDGLKAIGAAGASSGGVALFHAVGVTPEAPSLEAAFQGREPGKRIEVTEELLEEARVSLCSASAGPLSMVALGTPHFSVTEFQRLVELLDGWKIHPDVAFYVSTSRFVAGVAREKGWLDLLEKAGVSVLVDTCTYFAPAVKAARGRVMTNSAKWAYYAPGMLPVEVAFGDMKDCVEAAIRGEVRTGAAS